MDGITHSNLPSVLNTHGIPASQVKSPGSKGGKIYNTSAGTPKYAGERGQFAPKGAKVKAGKKTGGKKGRGGAGGAGGGGGGVRGKPNTALVGAGGAGGGGGKESSSGRQESFKKMSNREAQMAVRLYNYSDRKTYNKYVSASGPERSKMEKRYNARAGRAQAKKAAPKGAGGAGGGGGGDTSAKLKERRRARAEEKWAAGKAKWAAAKAKAKGGGGAGGAGAGGAGGAGGGGERRAQRKATKAKAAPKASKPKAVPKTLAAQKKERLRFAKVMSKAKGASVAELKEMHSKGKLTKGDYLKLKEKREASYSWF